MCKPSGPISSAGVVHNCKAGSWNLIKKGTHHWVQGMESKIEFYLNDSEIPSWYFDDSDDYKCSEYLIKV